MAMPTEPSIIPSSTRTASSHHEVRTVSTLYTMPVNANIFALNFDANGNLLYGDGYNGGLHNISLLPPASRYFFPPQILAV